MRRRAHLSQLEKQGEATRRSEADGAAWRRAREQRVELTGGTLEARRPSSQLSLHVVTRFLHVLIGPIIAMHS